MIKFYSFIFFIFCSQLYLAHAQNSNRSKQIDFEDNVVEGMNKNPLDFLEHVSNKDAKGAMALYKKRTNFRNEIRINSHEMGYVP